MAKDVFDSAHYPKGFGSLIGFMFLLLVLLFFRNSNNEMISGYAVTNTGEILFEDEIWKVPCTHIGSEDFVKEILRDNYACEDYCFKAVLGVELPFNNVAKIDCDSYDDRAEWIEMCKNHLAEFC